MLFAVGGGMYGVGRRLEAGDEGVRVQGIAGDIELDPAIQLATVSRANDYPRSTFTIVLVSRRLGDPGFVLPPCCMGLAAGCISWGEW
ncbi:MAG: hypothetical protein NTV68_00405 [Methanomicrobiales archaeon]|nr:hypothetical protein [Methanomicrobiales archaeon]